MGNCIRRESQMQWGGEDWSQVVPTEDEKLAMKMEEELGLGGLMKGEDHRNSYGNHNSYSNGLLGSAKTKTTEVKIKITKKQLETLMKRVDVEHDDLSVQQVLVQLMKVGAHFETHQRSGWRPRLQSIPEL